MKNYNLKFIAIFIFALLSTNILFAQSGSEKKLKEDLVNVIDNNYVIDDFLLIKTGEKQFQIKMSANAPLDIINRDNFISIYSTFGTMMLLSIFEEDGYSITDLDITDLDELIGQAEITINLIMAKNGMQMQIITDEGTERITMTWEEVLGK